MSDPRAKSERSKAKDARQMPAPDDKPKRKPGKKDKPWRVEYRWTNPPRWLRNWESRKAWSKHGQYRTKEEAEEVIRRGMRKNDYFEYRIVEPK